MSKKNKNTLVPKLRFPEFQNFEGWEEEKFNEICKFIRGPFGGALKKEIFISEGYAVYEQVHAIYGDFSSFRYFISEEKFNELKRFSVLPNDIIMSCSGTMGKFAIVPKNSKEGVINQALLKLTVKPGYEVNFIKTALELPVNQNKLLSQSAGGAIKNVVEVAQIKEIPLLIPSIKEQQKIAACLSSLDEVITAESQKLEVLKEHKKGLLQNLFPKEGESVPKVRFKEFENSGDWVERTIEQVAKVTTGNKDTQNKVDDGEYPFFVRSQNVERIDSYSYDGEAILTSGDGVGVGKNFHYINGKFDFHQRVYCIYDFEKEVSGKYVFMYFSQHFYKRVMRMSAKNSVDSVRKSMITEMPILMTSKKEQEKIASTLSSIDELITAQNQKIEALQLHKKGLLQGLFPQLSEP